MAAKRPDFSAEWPREESNLRARIRSPSLYPLSYGAGSASVTGGGEMGVQSIPEARTRVELPN